MAVAGTTTDVTQKPLPTSEWALLNDGKEDTVAVLNNDVELDFGDGGIMSDKIKVVWSKDNQASANGSILFVMDNDRKIIFQNLFVGLTAALPIEREFPLATLGVVVPILDEETAVIRYLRITRTSPGMGMGGGPENYMNVVKLEGLLGSRTPMYLYVPHTQNILVFVTVLCNQWTCF